MMHSRQSLNIIRPLFQFITIGRYFQACSLIYEQFVKLIPLGCPGVSSNRVGMQMGAPGPAGHGGHLRPWPIEGRTMP